MEKKLCEKLGIEFPLFAFSHCRDVVAAVSKAGGFGVFGAVHCTPDEMKEELDWINRNVDGMPFGVDLLVPENFESKGHDISDKELLGLVPERQKDFANQVLGDYGIDFTEMEKKRAKQLFYRRNLSHEGAQESLEVAFSYPIKLVVNALGPAPSIMIDMAKQNNALVGALVGKKEHAISQINRGVDILVMSGSEAGGHTGEVSSMVLTPEIVKMLGERKEIYLLSAGGITTGSQMAAAMAMGADGVWCGSVWLTTMESEVSEIIQEKMLQASSSDTIRSKSRTGKPSRQLKSPWVEAWESDEAPPALPMPLQRFVAEPALEEIDRLSIIGHQGAKKLSTYWVGQGVGLMDQKLSACETVYKFKQEFAEAYERLQAFIGT